MAKTDAEKTKEYREKTSLELIENYKDLIKKTFEVTDKDLLQEKIDSEDNKETEQKYLDAIKKRRIALDEVDIMLEKIEKIEIAIFGKSENQETEQGNTVKKFSKK